VLADALKASDWAGFAARRSQSKTRGKLLGRGMAAYIEASGGGFAPSGPGRAAFSARTAA